jgi:hypothetical protein
MIFSPGTASLRAFFDAWRDRYAVSGNSTATRAKRRNAIAAQRLRADAALLAEWFRICLRHGYIGNLPRTNSHEPKPRENGAEGLRRVMNYRLARNLELPMGPAAANIAYRPASSPNAPPSNRGSHPDP